ncbi:MAG: phosphoribosylformylglycinamidine cyclo-ligase, partial [Thermodesulfobacteriota bacterium]
VNKKELIDGSSVKEGDLVLGMSSNGLHSNGYSLARRVLFEKLKLKLSDKPNPLKCSVGEELMKPTKIYVRTVLSLKNSFKIHALAHITGGGLIENLPRVIPKGLKAVLDSSLWRLPPIFELIKMKGRIDDVEMYRTFNCGIGMILIVSSTDTNRVLMKLRDLKEKAMVIGEIKKRKRGEPGVLIN